MDLLKNLGKRPLPEWSDEKWSHVEEAVISRVRRKSNLLPFLIPLSSVAAALLLFFLLTHEGFKQSQLADRVGTDTITTEVSNGITTLRIGEVATIKSSEQSEVRIVAVDDSAIVVQIVSGYADFDVAKRGNGDVFRVVSMDAVAEVVGTRFRIELTKSITDTVSKLIVSEGVVKFYSVKEQDKVMFVGAGEFAILRHGKVAPPLRAIEEASIAKVSLKRAVVPVDTAISEVTKSVLLDLDDYIVAKSRIASGDYSGAMVLIDRLLAADHGFSQLDTILLMRERAFLYKKTGDFAAYAESMELLSRIDTDRVSAENQLWEAILLRSGELSDYAGAQILIREYKKRFSNGQWTEEAELKEAELAYALRKIDDAVRGYKNFIMAYRKSPFVDRALYHLAHIESHEIGDCATAASHYFTIISSMPLSALAEDAYFWYADCVERLGDKKTAVSAYKNYIAKYPNGRWMDMAKARVR